MLSRSTTVFLVAVIALAVGCGSADVTTGSGGNRLVVAGRIFSAGCPAQRQGQQCGTWFAGTVRILRQSGSRSSVVATARSDEGGRFHVSLPPGRYAVEAVGLFNRLTGQTFTVRARQRPVVVHLSINNGIE